MSLRERKKELKNEYETEFQSEQDKTNKDVNDIFELGRKVEYYEQIIGMSEYLRFIKDSSGGFLK